MNKDTVASLFFKRTGIKYQNWIQAWAVTKCQKEKPKRKLNKMKR